MNVLVIGKGGREHALVWRLAQSQAVTEMWCAPGNAGMAEERLVAKQKPVQCVNIGAEDLHGLLQFAQENKPALTVVGPDNPLALGVVAHLLPHADLRLRECGHDTVAVSERDEPVAVAPQRQYRPAVVELAAVQRAGREP